MHVVGGGRFVYIGRYSIAPKSLRAHKSGVFVKQQKAQKRKRAWKEKETDFNKGLKGKKSRGLQRMFSFTL